MGGPADLSAVAAATAAAIGRLPASPAVPLHQGAASDGPLQTHFSHATLEDLRAATEKFAADREWEKFHVPRNLLFALVGSDINCCNTGRDPNQNICVAQVYLAKSFY